VPQLEGWQITPFYRPAREVGGDFYDFSELEDGRLGLVVGDATGKGVPAALVMASARSMLRAIAQALGSTSPGDVLGRVNDALFIDIPANMFVTCFYAILDPKTGCLSYANAGHDLPYQWRGGEAEELRARGMPLGLMPGMSYEEKEIELDAGEGVLFYTDGLVEAHDPKGVMFGFPRLRALIADHGWRGESAGGLSDGGAVLLRRGGLGAGGGRHHPPYARAFRIPKLNFGDLRQGEVTSKAKFATPQRVILVKK
jgi:serine phosphatase RsbU (regulator of sigma subunit)